MTGYDTPELARAAHRDRVIQDILDTLGGMLARPMSGRLHATRAVRSLPELERVSALLWEIGLSDVEPDVEVLDLLRAEGLISREPSYSRDVEAEDAADPVWWIDAATQVGEIAPELREVWASEARPGAADAPPVESSDEDLARRADRACRRRRRQAREAGVDSEAE